MTDVRYIVGGWINLEAEVSYAALALEFVKVHHLLVMRNFYGLKWVGVGECRWRPRRWVRNGPTLPLGWFHPQVWEEEGEVEIVLKIHFNYRGENEEGEWPSPLPVLYAHKKLAFHAARNQSKIPVHQTADNSADLRRHDPRLRREPSEPHPAPFHFCNLTSPV